MITIANSKPCQTSEMSFLQDVTGFRGELRILPNIYEGATCKNSQKLKGVHHFCKILNVWQGSEYASELASKLKRCFIFKSIWISRVTDNLLGKTKKKVSNELKMLLNQLY